MPPRKDDSRWTHSDALPVVPLKLPQGNGPLRRLVVHVPPPPHGVVEIGALRGGCTVQTPPTRMVIPMSAMRIHLEVRWGSRRPRNSSIQSSWMAEDARFRRGCSHSIIAFSCKFRYLNISLRFINFCTYHLFVEYSFVNTTMELSHSPHRGTTRSFHIHHQIPNMTTSTSESKVNSTEWTTCVRRCLCLRRLLLTSLAFELSI
jgi:hypothetical protein